MNPVALELRKLNESLLSSSIDYTKTESSIDDRTLDLLKNTMFEFFRTFDKNDMGVVSFQECKEVRESLKEFVLKGNSVGFEGNGSGVI